MTNWVQIWDTPSENTGLWQLSKVSSALKQLYEICPWYCLNILWPSYQDWTHILWESGGHVSQTLEKILLHLYRQRRAEFAVCPPTLKTTSKILDSSLLLFLLISVFIIIHVIVIIPRVLIISYHDLKVGDAAGSELAAIVAFTPTAFAAAARCCCCVVAQSAAQWGAADFDSLSGVCNLWSWLGFFFPVVK